MALGKDRGTQDNNKRQTTVPIPMPMTDSILARHRLGKSLSWGKGHGRPCLMPLCSLVECAANPFTHPTSSQPLTCRPPADRIRISQPRKAGDAHHQVPDGTPSPSPLSLRPTPPELLGTPKGPNPPFIPSAQRDLHQVSLTAPQLGHPGPAYPIAHLILEATRRAAVCSPEACLYLRLLGGAAYYFHPLLRSI